MMWKYFIYKHTTKVRDLQPGEENGLLGVEPGVAVSKDHHPERVGIYDSRPEGLVALADYKSTITFSERGDRALITEYSLSRFEVDEAGELIGTLQDTVTSDFPSVLQWNGRTFVRNEFDDEWSEVKK